MKCLKKMQVNSSEQSARRRGIYYKAPISVRTSQSVKVCSILSSKIRNKTETTESPGHTHTLQFLQRKSENQVGNLIIFIKDSDIVKDFVKIYNIVTFSL